MSKYYREIKTEIQFEWVDNLDYSPHIHEDIEVMYIRKGHGIAHCDGKKYNLTENTFFVAFPNQVHRYTNSTMGDFILLVIKPSSLLGYKDLFINSEPISNIYTFKKHADDNIAFLYETAFKEFQRDGYSTIIDAYLTAFFGKLMKHFVIAKEHSNQDTVMQIMQYCMLHYKENITISDIAKSLNVSRSCVSHIFSDKIAINFCEYINALRLTDAQKLLRHKNYSMTEVAEMSGFSTIRTFNRAFIKQYGMTPSEYRRNILKN